MIHHGGIERMTNGMTRSAGGALFALLLTSCSTGGEVTHPTVTLETTMGDIRIELFTKDSPLASGNVLQSVEAGFYDGLIFHRVMPGFMIQGGGHEPDLSEKPPIVEPVQNESDNGLSNLRGTVAMARTGDPHSARAQFYINHVDNISLDYGNTMPGQANSWGYSVFGRVIEGMDVVDAIAATPTGSVGYYNDVPVEPVVITSARRGEDVVVSASTD